MEYIYQIAMHLGRRFNKWIRSETWNYGGFMYNTAYMTSVYVAGFGLVWLVTIFMNSAINN